jgi:tetratricopeptide (TPR) repeat protein
MKNTPVKMMRALLLCLAVGWAMPDAAAQTRPANRLRPTQNLTAEAENREEIINRLADDLNKSIREKEYERASTQIEALSRLVPAESMTLLRARAWYALAIGETGQAKQHYRLILRRIESDENAGINLAILESNDGNREAALKILTALSVRLPDSENVKAMRLLLLSGGATDPSQRAIKPQ